MVDPRSVFVKLTILNIDVEAVRDCGASVSCLNPKIYDELKKRNDIPLNACTRNLRAANVLPIAVKGVIRVPVRIGTKQYVHEFRVLENSEADCLLGLDFLETNKCDPLFSQMKLRLDSTQSVPMYHKPLSSPVMQCFESLPPKQPWYQLAMPKFCQPIFRTGRNHLSP